MTRTALVTSCLVLCLTPGWTSRAQPAAPPASPRAPAAPPPAPRPPAPADVSPDLAAIVKQHDVPGMVAVVVEGDRVVATGAAGVRKRGGRDKVALADKFHIGSCTKTMTATLCAILVEEGKLKWDASPARVLAADVKSIDPGWRKATLEQLLQNRGGAPGDIDPGLWATLWVPKGTAARRMLAQGILSKPPAAEPGTTYAYSNAGYAIAGLMAERATGRAWEDLMREKLFKPVGMTSAGFGAPTGPAAPRGHSVDGKPKEPTSAASDNPPAIGPAGTVHCTAGDWARFVSLHLAGSRGNAKLLKSETFKKLHTPPDGEKYAMGWIVVTSPLGDGTALTHAGSNTMWFAVTWVLPKQNVAVLVMCNQGGPGTAGDKACDEAVGKLVQKHLKAAKARPTD